MSARLDLNLYGKWPTARLGDVARYINGRAFKPSEWCYDGIPIIRIQNLNDPEAPFNYCNGHVDNKHWVRDGDLLVSWSASLDAFIWNRGDAALNQHIFKVVEQKEIVDRHYLYYALREVMAEIREQTHGATMKHINKPEFEAFEIPLPPLSEQERIAAMLTNQLAAVERARRASEARLEAARALPKAWLREVFEGSEASSWGARFIWEIAELLPSKSIATAGDTDVVAVTTACLSEAGFQPDGLKTAKMNCKDAKNSLIRPGEILIARSNTPELVGRVSIYPGKPAEIVASDLTIRIWPREGIVGSFLGYFLSYLYQTGYWRNHAGGASGSMKKITRTQVLEKEIPVPPKELQISKVRYLDCKIRNFHKVERTLHSEASDLELLSSTLIREAFARVL